MKTCIIISGPTASGKTALAVEVARRFSTDIISADSRQCYKELNIGVAKPSAEELASVHHYFINSHSIHDSFSAAGYEQYAMEKAALIFKKNDTAVMVGGTGLYIKAFCEGLDDIPAVDENIRKEIVENYEKDGMEWLLGKMRQEDPDFLLTGEAANPHRMMRALEVKLFTGKTIASFRIGNKKKRDFNIVQFAIGLPRETLYERINQRVDQMIADGLVEEARQLQQFQHLNALQTVGYKELFEYFDNSVSLEKATDLIKQHTRQYAKRQLTWFKRDPAITWLQGSSSQIAEQLMQELPQ